MNSPTFLLALILDDPYSGCTLPTTVERASGVAHTPGPADMIRSQNIERALVLILPVEFHCRRYVVRICSQVLLVI